MSDKKENITNGLWTCWTSNPVQYNMFMILEENKKQEM